MFKKKDKPKPSEENFMLYVPIVKHHEFQMKKGKVLLIFRHDHLIQKAAFWLVKKPRVSDLELDELSSFVWLSIDGKRNVYEIGQAVKEKFGEDAEPLYERLIMFLRYLSRKGWIVFSNKAARASEK